MIFIHDIIQRFKAGVTPRKLQSNKVAQQQFVRERFVRDFVFTGNIDVNNFKIGNGSRFLGENTINYRFGSAGNAISIGDNFSPNNLKIVMKCHNSKLIIGDNVKFTGHILIVGNNLLVKIGHNTTVQGAYILSREKDVIIGSDCLLSRGIEIRSTDVHKVYDLDTNKRLNPAQEVVIGDKVWICARTVISKGSKIPNGSIIGILSFVNKEFTEENTIIAGIPAKIVKKNIHWKR